MSEEDRAAKAARAKALLKKRQQKKAGGPSTAGAGAILASPPPSRSFTPALSDVSVSVKDERNNVDDLFYKTESDGNWLESLPRVDVQVKSPTPGTTVTQSYIGYVPSPEEVIPPVKVESPPAHGSSDELPQNGVPAGGVTKPGSGELESVVEQQRLMISKLENEKSALQASQDRLFALESQVQEKDTLVHEERARYEALNSHSKQLQQEVQKAAQKIQEMSAREKESQESLADSLQRLQRLEADMKQKEEALVAERARTHSLEDRVHHLESDVHQATQRIQELRERESQLGKQWQSQLDNQQATISLLVQEKASLSASVDSLRELEADVQEKDSLLHSERERSQALDRQVQSLEAASSKLNKEYEELLDKEKELAEKYRDQERAQQLTLGTVEQLRSEAEQHRRRAVELEEHIKSDDRVDRLEESLKNTSERAEELEFQLTKQKQLYSTLKAERADLASQLRQRTEAETEWRQRYENLQQEHSALQHNFHSAQQNNEGLSEERAALQSQVQFNQSAVKQLQQKLAEVASELASSERTLLNVQNELRVVSKRADDAERTQKDLQAEGTAMMHSLDEMRAKIVELTSTKLQLVEQKDSLEHALKNRDALISQLETQLEEMKDVEEQSRKLWDEAIALRDKDLLSAQTAFTEVQKAYADLQADLNASQTREQVLENECSKLRQSEARQSDALGHLSSSAQQQADELADLHRELEAHKHLVEEQRNLAEQARSEIESLREQLSLRDEELERTRAMASSDGPRSLDDEMMSAYKQDQSIELSTAQSQIRALEATLFEAQTASHNLQMQVNSLGDQLAQSRSASRATQRPFSPGIPSRPSSRSVNHADIRRSSLGYHPNHLLTPPSRSVFDIGLSPETRHKRQVSLNMLKARIDSEMMVVASNSRPSSKALSPAPVRGDGVSLPTLAEPDAEHSDTSKRRQFMDESHIFWCHSCRGDLVIL